MSKPRKYIGHQITKARKQKGWSRQDLAKKIGTDRKNVDRWETDRVRPSLKFLSKLAATLDISPSLLLPGMPVGDSERTELIFSTLSRLEAGRKLIEEGSRLVLEAEQDLKSLLGRPVSASAPNGPPEGLSATAELPAKGQEARPSGWAGDGPSGRGSESGESEF